MSIQSKLYKEALFIEHQIELNNPIKQILSDISLSHLNIAILKDDKIINQTKYFSLKNISKYTKEHTSFFTVNNSENIKAILTLKFKAPFDGTIRLLAKLKI